MAEAALKARDLIAEVRTALNRPPLIADVTTLSEGERNTTVAMRDFEEAAKTVIDLCARIGFQLPEVWSAFLQVSDLRRRGLDAREVLPEILGIYPVLIEERKRQEPRIDGFKLLLREANQLKSPRFAVQASRGVALSQAIQRETLALLNAFKDFESKLRRLIAETESLETQTPPRPPRPVPNPDAIGTAKKIMAKTKRARAHLAK